MNEVDLFEAMLRDTLTIEEYIAAKYNPLDFEERDLNVQDMKFLTQCYVSPLQTHGI